MFALGLIVGIVLMAGLNALQHNQLQPENLERYRLAMNDLREQLSDIDLDSFHTEVALDELAVMMNRGLLRLATEDELKGETP